jgi:hypothetical protein
MKEDTLVRRPREASLSALCGSSWTMSSMRGGWAPTFPRRWRPPAGLAYPAAAVVRPIRGKRPRKVSPSSCSMSLGDLTLRSNISRANAPNSPSASPPTRPIVMFRGMRGLTGALGTNGGSIT